MPHTDVIVVGGGVIGAACARALAHEDVTVTLVEGGPFRGAASLAAAGMLAPFFEAAAEDPLLGFAVRARDVYRELAPALEEATGVDIALWTEGILHLAFTEEQVAAIRGDMAWQRQSGFAAEWLTADELRERAPGISPDALGAALAPEDGALDPLALLDALIKDAEAHGVTVVRGEPVGDVMIRNAKVEGVRTSSTLYAAETVVLAAGAWSGQIKGLPRPVSVEPIRGQMVAMAWPADEPPAVVYGSNGYVVARDNQAIGGSTMEYVGFDASVTDEGTEHIENAMAQIYPTLEGAPPLRTWAGLRPVTPDGRPLIGSDPRVSGLWYATGHGRNGVLLAAYTGEVISRLVTGKPVDYDLTPVDPARFWSF